MSTELHCILVAGIDYWQGAIVNLGRPGMDGCVTEAQCHAEVGIEEMQQEFTGVQWGYRRKV